MSDVILKDLKDLVGTVLQENILSGRITNNISHGSTGNYGFPKRG
jgi:hypothetical protein